MLLVLAAIIFLAWLFGFFAFHIAGGFIHILLIAAAIAIIWHFVTGHHHHTTV